MFRGLKIFLIALISTLAIVSAANAFSFKFWEKEPVKETPTENSLGARTDNSWNDRGTYLEVANILGRDILINGTNKYLNFNSISGSSGYGFRDNGGTMESKNNGGSWTPIGTGSGGGGGGSNWVTTTAGVLYPLDYATRRIVTGGNSTTTNDFLQALNGFYANTARIGTLTGYLKGATGIVSATTTIPYTDITGVPAFVTSSITSLNGLTAATQTFATGTAGTDLNVVSSGSTHTFNIPTSSASVNRGLLLGADWATFNNKQAALVSGTNIKTINGSSLLGSGDLAVSTSVTTSTIDHNQLFGLQGGSSTERYHITLAQLTIVSSTSGTNSGNETTSSIGALINGAPATTTPGDTDLIAMGIGSVLNKLTWSNLKATLKTYFDTVYQPIITILAVNKGGTGTTTLTGFVVGNGTSAMSATNTIDISTNTNLAVSGSLLQLIGDTLSIKEGTLTNGSGCTFVTGTGLVCNSTFLTSAITSLNGLSGASQTFATGTAGVDINVSSVGTTHTINIPTSSATINRGLLSGTDWSTFNNKQAALVSGTNIKTVNGSSLLGSGNLSTAETTATIGALINGAPATTTPGDNDLVAMSVGSVLNKLTWANVKATLKTYFDTLYQPLDATLTALAGLTITQGSITYGTGADAFAVLAKNTTATRYLANTGSSNNPQWDYVNLANGVTGTLPIFNGGTGGTTASTAINGLLPTQTGNSGKYLTTDGSSASWNTISGSGDVVGPAASTDNAIVRFNSTTGKLIKNSNVTIGNFGDYTSTVTSSSNVDAMTITQNDNINNKRALRLVSNVNQTADGTREMLTLESTTSTDAGAFIGYYNNSASPATSDYMGQNFYFNNASAAKFYAGGFSMEMTDTTASSEDTDIYFRTLINGTNALRMMIGNDGSSSINGITIGASTATGTVSSYGAQDLNLKAGSGSGPGIPAINISATTGNISFNTVVGAPVSPSTNDGAPLGSATLNWSDLFLASGSVLNFANGNVLVTHSSGVLTVGTGDLRVTNAGTNSASVVTVGGSQTLTNKTLTNPIISSPFTLGATSVTTTGAELNQLAGVSSNVQAQLNAKISSQWTTLTNNIYYNTGYVGIGTSTPTNLLNILSATTTPQFNISYSTTASTTFATDANGDLTIAPSGSDIFIGASRLGRDSTALFDFSTSGQIKLRVNNIDQLVFDSMGNIQFKAVIETNQTSSGQTALMTVGTNSYGFGALLYVNSTGTLDMSNALVTTTVPAVFMALETGSGANKKVLMNGIVRNDSWNFTGNIGKPVYVSTSTVGSPTTTLPTGVGQQIQTVGIVLSSTTIRFMPDLTQLEL